MDMMIMAIINTVIMVSMEVIIIVIIMITWAIWAGFCSWSLPQMPGGRTFGLNIGHFEHP